GFWTGEIWLAYEYVLENPGRFERGTAAKLKEAALTQVDSFLERIENKVSVDHHDMGFLYSPSCVAAHKLVGSEKGRNAALLAADQLLTRYQEKGEFLQAWGPMGAKENYRLIIDCLNNLPLLYWASAETRNPKYRAVAEKHITTAIKVVIRDDYSTWHTFFFDPETGRPDHGATCQGYKDDSVWARGQAWGVAGLATAYRYTRRSEYIPLFERVTAYFLEHLPEDLVPYWDFTFTDGSDEPRDSSSASIAVCGMLEAARYLPEKEARYYIAVSKRMMKSIYDKYAVKNPEESNGLVLHSTYSKKSPYNTCTPEGVDECNIWGDYYYMEALTRLSKDWKQYW
ncbi:MAG: glycoside hydrolase family 88 protein, partial [Lachnospiraceae bacterium]|nr:glycoside hydrolase family 88 protein [Lachnospiraceae bacterium]